jgi:hypothetical protein
MASGIGIGELASTIQSSTTSSKSSIRRQSSTVTTFPAKSKEVVIDSLATRMTSFKPIKTISPLILHTPQICNQASNQNVLPWP